MKLSRIWKRPSAKILFTGIILGVLLLAVMVYYAFVDREIAEVMVLTFFAHSFGGRAAGIGLCILNGFGSAATIGYNFYLEVLIVCFTYGIFVLTTIDYLQIKWATKIIDRLEQKAQEQKTRIESYGWIGIFLFVMVPLPVTGPVTGSIIGYMLGLKPAKNFSATLLGTLSAIVIWFYCFDFLEERFHMIQYIFGAIVVIVLLPYVKGISQFVKSLREP